MIRYMKNIMLLILGGILITGCCGCSQQEFMGEPTHEYDYILEQFNNDLSELGYEKIDFSKTSINLKEDGFSTLGRCHGAVAVRNSGPVTITLNKNRFGLFPDFARIAVLYHEIGHCFLGLNHSEKRGKVLMTGYSIYNTFDLDDINIKENRIIYFKEMLESSEYK